MLSYKSDLASQRRRAGGWQSSPIPLKSALGSASALVCIFGTALGCRICARLHRGDTGKVQRWGGHREDLGPSFPGNTCLNQLWVTDYLPLQCWIYDNQSSFHWELALALKTFPAVLKFLILKHVHEGFSFYTAATNLWPLCYKCSLPSCWTCILVLWHS